MAGHIPLDAGLDGGPARATRYAWLVFALSFGLLISDYMARQVLNAVFPLLKAEWSLTETSPVGTVGGLPAALADTDEDLRTVQQLKQGRPPFGVELRLVDDSGAILPHDGKTQGRLMVRGLAVAGAYFNGAGGEILDENGFFDTGDVATIDAHGTMQITDRAKDVIKSGGEWISSIEIENIALSHPAVANAAAIGVPHPKWDERPVLVVEARAGMAVSADDLRGWLDGRIARWWMPDDYVFVETIPLGPTGKVNKLALREHLRDGR